VLWVLFGLALAGSGYLSYRMDGRGWLVGVSLTGFLVASTSLTYQRAGIAELYAGMGMDIPLELFSGPSFRRLFLVTMAPVTVFYAGYFAWVRRFFPRLLTGTAGREKNDGKTG
jgi:hypothetical protein